MARLRTTGKGPTDSSYDIEGQTIDVPATEPLYQELIDKGWAEAVAAVDDPARTPLQIANAVVRGDPLTDPADQAAVKKYGFDDPDKARAAVHLQDPDATLADLEQAPDVAAENDLTVVGTGDATATAQREAAAEAVSSSSSKSSSTKSSDKS